MVTPTVRGVIKETSVSELENMMSGHLETIGRI